MPPLLLTFIHLTSTCRLTIMRSAQSIARQRLDQRLGDIPEGLLAKPAQGWIAAIRDALGMSVRDLGRRMGTSGQRASKLEHDELSGGIQLSSLERAAAVMNCRLVYALIPNEPLEEMVRRQARKKAAQAVGAVSHNLRLEDQAVADAVGNKSMTSPASSSIVVACGLIPSRDRPAATPGRRPYAAQRGRPARTQAAL